MRLLSAAHRLHPGEARNAAARPGTNRLQVTCEPDELLLLGNCMLDGVDSATLANVTMFRFGILPGDDDTWGCSWNNPDAVPATAVATALCVAD